jgi:Protein of unknown function (DUF3102)
MNIVTDTVNVKPDDLAALAATIRSYHERVVAAIGNALNHAFAAGEALIEAKAKVPHGDWAAWVQRCGINERTARRYMQLAKARSIIESKTVRATDLTLAGALRMIGNKGSSGGRGNDQGDAPAPRLSSYAWSEATLEERRKFLDAVGPVSILEAIPRTWQPQFQRYAQRDTDDRIAKCLRLALAGTISEATAPEAINALRTVKNLIAASGHDPHEIVGLKFNRRQTIDKTATAADAA